MIPFYFDQLSQFLSKKIYSSGINYLNKLIFQQTHGGMLCFGGTVSSFLPNSANFFSVEKTI